MRTRARFALLFSLIGLAVMAIAVAAIYAAVGRDALRRLPSEAESLLAAASRGALDPSVPSEARLEAATESLIAARALLAQGRVMERDAVVRLAIRVAAILAATLLAAAAAFLALSRPITRALAELAAGAVEAQSDRGRRFPRSSDPELDAVARALNELLDLAAEQEGRLAEAARLEGWREVASFLAHQLKNPLAAARLAAGNARMGLRSGDQAVALEGVETALAETDRLAALIDRFRDLAPSGLVSYNAPSRVDLAAVLGACAARAQIMGARAEILGPQGGAIVAGDTGLVEQAFWNLFANSIEAAGGGGGIEASLAVEGRDAVVVLRDSNEGLDPALAARLGRERVTTKDSGTGLGLILVRRILAALGGGLELSLSDRGGLVARIRLPLAQSPREGA